MKAFYRNKQIQKCYLGSTEITKAYFRNSSVCQSNKQFEMLVTSPEEPTFIDCQTTDNQDGTWTVFSYNPITTTSIVLNPEAGTPFDEDSKITKVKGIKTDTITDFSYFLNRCSLLTEAIIDTKNALSTKNMFSGCKKLINAVVNTPKVTIFSGMYQGCISLPQAPQMDTENGISFDSLFYGCEIMTQAPDYDLRNGEDFHYYLGHCKKLVHVPVMNTPKGKDFVDCFDYCLELECIAGIDTRASTHANDAEMFSHTPKLVHPTATEQQQIIDGSLFTSNCQATDKITDFNATDNINGHVIMTWTAIPTKPVFDASDNKIGHVIMTWQ